ncbi:hypothetical protein KVH31_13720 [Streptomyces olivaceus]|uniref:hypothetical protein n=1 Tax=Streptomyces olivaceus TaxID=47716 RepID=UPI001CCE860B|nr:hypothetical protein [Streptomyces olivaceus]MBZ6207558.1 hypothetical protein [Streptomyces olivaceus]
MSPGWVLVGAETVTALLLAAYNIRLARACARSAREAKALGRLADESARQAEESAQRALTSSPPATRARLQHQAAARR